MRHTNIADSSQRAIGTTQLRADTSRYLTQLGPRDVLRVLRRGRACAVISASRDDSVTAADPRQPVIRLPLTFLRSHAGRVLDRVSSGVLVEVIHNGSSVAWISPDIVQTAAR
jgi:antitoxin (DNA-binding transcriptional repressor) of toxin-antitoxin stability system